MIKRELNVMLSIIVPVHNSEEYLEECINSILSQSYRDIELILVENNSTDMSLKICRQYEKKDARVKVLVEERESAAIARNSGIGVAGGDYITFVDSDDYLRQDAYQTLINQMECQQADAVCYSYQSINENGVRLKWYEPRLSRYLLKKKCFSGKEIASIFLSSRDIEGFAWNKIFKMSFFKDNNILFDESKVAYEDMAVFFEALLQCRKVILCPQKLYFYRQVPSSLTHKDYEKKTIEYEEVIQQIIKIANSSGIILETKVFQISRDIWNAYDLMKNGVINAHIRSNYSFMKVACVLFKGLKSEKWKTLVKAGILFLSNARDKEI